MKLSISLWLLGFRISRAIGVLAGKYHVQTPGEANQCEGYYQLADFVRENYPEEIGDLKAGKPLRSAHQIAIDLLSRRKS